MHTTWYLKEWKHLTDLGVDESIILKCVLIMGRYGL
jgi:hypothetical protein